MAMNKKPLWIAAASVATLFLFVSFVWWLNQGYGEVSPLAYQYSKALYRACQTKDETHLRRIEEMISGSAPQDMPENERRWLMAIIEKARNGKWQAASRKARRMMEDQVVY